MKQGLLRLYAALLSILFGIAITAQILAFVGLYRPLIAIPLTLAMIIGAFWLYQRHASFWETTLSPQQSDSSLLQWMLIASSVVIVSVVYLQRMILWYQSSAGRIISSDFYAYHSPKIFQLLRDGSAWNLAIPYGQYPFGFESLIAFFMLFIPDIRVMGIVFALVFVVLWLTLALLMMRYAQFSVDVSLFLATGLSFVPLVFPQLMNIGKNDVLLSTTILIALLHAPVGDKSFHPIGLAFATMLSLATKATGLYVLFYFWGLVMLGWWQHYQSGTWRNYLSLSTFVMAVVLMFPGGLWVIRNYIVLGEVYTSEISSFFQTTIVANLDNPYLYNSWQSIDLGFHLVVAAVLGVLGLFVKRLGWRMFGTIFTLIVTFMITPLAIFLTNNDLDYLDVQWRFVIHGSLILWIILIVLLSPVVRRVYAWVTENSLLSGAASVTAVGVVVAVIVLIGIDDLTASDPQQWQRMIDPTEQEDSIYDEIATLDAGVIYLESLERLPILIRNPELSITELRYPLGRSDVYPRPEIDYIAVAPNRELSATLFVLEQWEMIFADATGTIYQRVP